MNSLFLNNYIHDFYEIVDYYLNQSKTNYFLHLNENDFHFPEL